MGGSGEGSVEEEVRGVEVDWGSFVGERGVSKARVDGQKGSAIGFELCSAVCYSSIVRKGERWEEGMRC